MNLSLMLATFAVTNLLAAPVPQKGKKAKKPPPPAAAEVEKAADLAQSDASVETDVSEPAEVVTPPATEPGPVQQIMEEIGKEIDKELDEETKKEITREIAKELEKEYGDHDGKEKDGDVEPGEDEVMIGQSNEITEDEWVRGDAVVVGGDLTVDGRVDGDAVCVGGTLTLGPKAVVGGDAVNVGGKADISETATVEGERVNVGVAMGPLSHLSKLGDHKAKHGKHGEGGILKRVMDLIWEIAMFAFFMFIALLLTVFMPRQFQRIEDHLTGAFPRSALMGAAVMLLVPLLMLILAVTIVGIPLIPLVMIVVGITMIVGFVVFSRVLGRRLIGDKHIMLQIFGGMLLLSAASLLGDALALPGGVMETVAHVFRFIGGVIFVGASFAGLGSVLYSKWGKRSLDETEASRSTNGNSQPPQPPTPQPPEQPPAV